MTSTTPDQHIPLTDEAWASVETAASAPVDDLACPNDPSDPAQVEAVWQNSRVVSGGGESARATPARRRRGRGPGRKARKIKLTVRVSPEVVAYFKATGAGWQARMDAVLVDYARASHRHLRTND